MGSRTVVLFRKFENSKPLNLLFLVLGFRNSNEKSINVLTELGFFLNNIDTFINITRLFCSKNMNTNVRSPLYT